jgi:hypothetical protein
MITAPCILLLQESTRKYEIMYIEEDWRPRRRLNLQCLQKNEIPEPATPSPFKKSPNLNWNFMELPMDEIIIE